MTRRSLDRKVLTTMTSLVRAHIKEWMKEATIRHFGSKVFRAVGTTAAARCACKAVLSRIHRETPFIDVARDIGTRIEQVIVARKSRDEQTFNRRLRQLASNMGISKAREIKMKEKVWVQRDRLSIGSILLHMIREYTGMIDFIDNPEGGRRPQKVVIGTPETIEWLEKTEELFDQDRESWLPARTPHPDYELAVPRLHRALNKSQAIAWRVNKRVLDVVQECFLEGIPVADLPSGRKPKIPKGVPKRVWARAHHSLYEWTTHRRRTALHLSIARSMPEKVWFRWSNDFRGRLSPAGRFVYPHGTDLGKALLEFADGEPLGDGMPYLAHHGANCWGLSKKSYAERLAWVDNHREHIIKSAREPLDFRWWEEAHDPWRFLRFCFELDEADLYGPDYVTHLPCQIDGTANGLQIVACLLRDQELAEKVNLVDADCPVDIYSVIAADVEEECRRDDPWGWLKEGFDRSTVKGATLAFAFGGNLWAATNAVTAWFWKQSWDFPFRGSVNGPCSWMARQVQESLKGQAPSFQTMKTWVTAAAKQCENGVAWTSPIGLPVRVAYYRRHEYKVRDHFRAWDNTEEIHRGKTTRATLPNFIQSLDAAALIDALNHCDFPVLPTHDCFGALPRHMGDLHREVRASYAKLFSRNLLQEWVDQIGIDTPELPAMGVFDPSVIQTARYSFT
jgi:hypothetical protein